MLHRPALSKLVILLPLALDGFALTTPAEFHLLALQN
jgi:hypothetical protein